VSISVIIPTLNAEKHIPHLINNLWHQQQIPSEILIIDSSSEDNTRAIAEGLKARVIKINRDAFDHGGTRNFAIKRASGEIIIFLTQDAIPLDRFFIGNLIAPLRDASVPLSYGRQIPRDNADPIEIFTRTFNYPEQSAIKDISQISVFGIKTFFCSNVCSAIRRKEFEEIGGFPENIIMNEDMVLAAKLILKGYKVAYQSSAKVFHSHNYSLKEQFQRYFDIGVSINRNRWILNNIRAEGEGIKLLKAQTRYLVKQQKWFHVFYSLVQAAVKFSGYRLGLAEISIPKRLKKSFSMHKYFWENEKTRIKEAF